MHRSLTLAGTLGVALVLLAPPASAVDGQTPPGTFGPGVFGQGEAPVTFGTTRVAGGPDLGQAPAPPSGTTTFMVAPRPIVFLERAMRSRELSGTGDRQLLVTGWILGFDQAPLPSGRAEAYVVHVVATSPLREPPYFRVEELEPVRPGPDGHFSFLLPRPAILDGVTTLRVVGVSSAPGLPDITPFGVPAIDPVNGLVDLLPAIPAGTDAAGRPGVQF